MPNPSCLLPHPTAPVSSLAPRDHARSRRLPIGLDYGTSNSLLSVYDGGRVIPVALDGDDPRLASILYAERSEPAPGGPAQRSTEQTLAQALARAGSGQQQSVLFGNEALLRHFEEPAGFFVRSPKSFLAADIDARHLDTFVEVIARFLTHMRETAERRLDAQLRDVVIGRPVHYQGARHERANRQALELTRRAAETAGFERIEFLEEPVAAALDYERTLRDDRVVLVLDAGGGTTDCTVMRLGPGRAGLRGRAADILSTSGERIGGLDIDMRLTWLALMDVFGRKAVLKDGLPMPHDLLHKAIAIDNVQDQAAFFGAQPAIERLARTVRAEHHAEVDRLEQLREQRGTHWLVNAAERAKIALTDAQAAQVALDRVWPPQTVTVDRALLREGAAVALTKFERLMREAVAAAGVRPEAVYITGGTARSPVVRPMVEALFPGVEIVSGDSFASVVGGLAVAAGSLFGER